MSASAHAHAHGEHISSLGTYYTIYGALLILTVLTYAVSYAGLPGSWSIVAAISVALVKSFLVAGWFMHLKYDVKFNLFVFLSAFWFMLVFFGFTLNDLGSRGNILQLSDNLTRRAELGQEYAKPAVLIEHEGGHGGGHGEEAAPAHGEEAPAEH